jgi:hypothetical protein
VTNVNSPLPNRGHLASGYSTRGDNQNNCMSTARYHVWFRHCNKKRHFAHDVEMVISY